MEQERRRRGVTDLIFDGISKVGSEYDFTVLSAGRALQIQSGMLPFSRTAGKGPLETAIEEIIEGRVEIKHQDEDDNIIE
ncbi:MAG: DNA-directed RNA polymerase subunit omega [Candidatus Coatesbacteria bacterium]|nr:DNA-directed RNA polymerase subunit omega [Candidatus Coatesbacteria bacterium]